MYRDYGPKGVKVFFVYKALAHPELAGDYVQPFTLDERLAHARQARKQLGASVPWLVDPIDNRLKHALGDRPNSEYVIDPKGKIVRKRAWSDPGQVRKDLETLVGPVDHITREEDLKLKLGLPPKSPAVRGVVARIPRARMQPIVMEPVIDPKGPPFYAKLRAEADADLLAGEPGKLYLGFHLDPFHEAHWNNLNPPLRYTIEVPDGVKIDKPSGEAAKVKEVTDADPREFLLTVGPWPDDKPLRLTVSYSACVGDKSCYAVKQSYVLRRARDKDGGAAKGEGAGYWDPEGYARQMLSRSKDGGKLTREEAPGLVRPHFDAFDTNKDGFLDLEELKAVAEWLNHHHRPGNRPNSVRKE
ncbi:MAG TPA: EF-hand domain-containing protein [Gemmataceae bacterium]|nr:EF-hand domain-containing protein [Gemmataceae bacterium]